MSNKKNSDPNDISRQLALLALKMGAISVQPTTPFLWASGYFMPIYNDNRLLLGSYSTRMLISQGFRCLLESAKLNPDAIAGCATAGIAPGLSLADSLELPFLYVRGEAKKHGRTNQIEGFPPANQKILLIEDLISTGGSSLAALKAIRKAGGEVLQCFSIFSYGFRQATENFQQNNSSYQSLLNLELLVEVAEENNFLDPSQSSSILEWQEAPFGWGEKNGFPPKQSAKGAIS